MRPEATCCAGSIGSPRPREAYRSALALVTNPSERAFLERRLREVATSAD